MEQVLIFLAVGAALIIAIIAAVYSWKQEQKRREALMAFAHARGWQFDASKDSRHDNEYAHFAVFRRGHSRRAFNTMRGSVSIDGRDCPVKAGDFLYKITRSNGKSTSTTTYRFSYLILHLPFAHVPDLLIRPENFLDKIAGAIGFDDIDFESEEFSRKFHVASKDKRFAYDVITPAMMEFLLATRGPMIDLEHGAFCLTDGTRRWSPDEFEGWLNWGSRFIDLWPDHVTATLASRTHDARG